MFPWRADPAPTNNSLPASPYSLFEKRESPGDRLRWSSSPKREFCFLRSTTTYIV